MPSYIVWNPGCGYDAPDSRCHNMGSCPDITWFWLALAAVAALAVVSKGR